MKRTTKITLTALLAAAAIFSDASAEEISTDTAIMQAMDKITGQVSLIEVPVNHEVKFGTFSIVVRECKTRPPEETPENFAFVDVVDDTNAGPINIFKGWMISSSPALNPVAHPVYDVWLLKCVNKDTATQKMTDEELRERDEIIMNRTNYTSSEFTQQQNTVYTEERIPGEPINLIPSEIEETEQRPVQPQPVDATPDATPQQPLVQGIAPSETENSVKEDNPSSPAAANDGVPEPLLAVDSAEKSVETDTPNQDTYYKVVEELPQSSSQSKTTTAPHESNNNEHESAIVPDTSENADNIAERILKLEQELSAEAIQE